MSAEISYRTEILPEILELAKKINAKLRSNGNPPEIKGWKVWYSNIIEHPNCLFIGINPNNVPEDIEYFGSPALEIDGLKIQLESDEDIRYNSDENWSLSVFTREVFQNVGLPLSHNVKINYYYLGTDNVKTLDSLNENKYIGETLNAEFRDKSAEWTRKIVELIKPKIIICEGIESFNAVVNDALKPHKDKIKIEINSGNIRKATFENIPIIGYSRIQKANETPNIQLEFTKLLNQIKIDYLA
ncbi:hypothetical protein [Sediminibacterium sp.]|uniref:hypothetical protein n=1 Tax=Sediminibacterium sp. TaxID=1917865 RepID=UPI003F72519E